MAPTRRAASVRVTTNRANDLANEGWSIRRFTYEQIRLEPRARGADACRERGCASQATLIAANGRSVREIRL